MKKNIIYSLLIISIISFSSLIFVEGIFAGNYDFPAAKTHNINYSPRKPVQNHPLIIQHHPSKSRPINLNNDFNTLAPAIHQSSAPKTSSFSMRLDTITYPNNTPSIVMRGNDILIKGILWTGPYDRWDNEPVSLYWNINSTQLNDIIQNDADPRTTLDNNYLISTNTTNSEGEYLFRLSTDNTESSVVSKLGLHDFVVYFWGDSAKAREAGIAGYGTIEIRGIISFSVTMTTASELSAGSNVYYEFQATLKFDNGSYVKTSDVKINFTETRNNLNTPAGVTTTQISDFSSQPVTYSNLVGDQSPPGGSITVYYSLYGDSLTNLTNNYPYFNITNVPNGQKTITVTVDVNFQIQLWNGTAYETRNYLILKQDEYFAANVTLTISDGTQTNPVPNKDIRLVLTQAGVVKYNQTYTSNSNGIVLFNVSIDLATYTQVGDNITATFTYLDPTDTVKPSKIQKFGIILNGTVSSIVAKINNPNDYRLLSETILVSGNVTDSNGNPAKNVEVYVFYNYTLNQKYFKTITDSNGHFEITIDFSQLDATGQSQDSLNLYVNFIPTPTPYTGNENGIWVGKLTDVLIQSVNIVRSISAAFETYEVNATNGETITWNILNETFVSYFNGSVVSSITGVAKKFIIKMLDQAGRFPYGFQIDIKYNDQLIYTDYTSSSLTYPISYDPTLSQTPVNQTLFITGGKLKWEIVISKGSTIITSISTTYNLYGPDIHAPQFPNGVSENPAENTINGQRQPRYNVTILVQVQDPSVDYTGIKNVVLFYRYWYNNSFSTNDNDYTAVLMQTNDNVTWYFMILFPDPSVFGGETPHGKWVQYFIVAYDYAGFGHNISSSTRFTSPQYDPLISNEARLYANATTREPFMYQLGDADAPSVDLGNNVQINGSRLNVFIGNTQQPAVINVTVTVFDLGGITGANITYRTRKVAYDPNTNSYYNITSWSSNTTVAMHLLKADTTNGYYTFYIILNATDQYQIEVDFYLSIKDIGQHITTTPTASTYLRNTEGNTFRLPKVVDTNPPVQIGTTQAVANTGPIQNNYQFTNHTTSEVNVTLVFRDTQTGINVTATTVLFRFYSAGNTSEVYARGILRLVPFQNNTWVQFRITLYNISNFQQYNLTAYGLAIFNSTGFLVIKFVLPALPEEFVQNSEKWNDDIILSWLVSVKDYANNEAVVTQQYIYQRVIPPPPATVINPGGEEQGGPNIYLIIVLFLVTIVVVMVFYRWKSIMEWIHKKEQLGRITLSLRQKLDEINRLGAEGKYRRAVILAYRAMEEIASKNLYAPRLENQTVREFAEYLADLTAVSEETLMIIAENYEKAKYSNEEITYEDFDNVVKALEVTIQTITRLGVKAFEE